MGPRATIAALALAALLVASLVVLGLIVPFDDPARDRVDNALLLLGGVGLINTFLVGRSGLVLDEPVVRALSVVVAVLCAAALALADFGLHRGLGRTIKALGLALSVAVLLDAVRRPTRPGGRSA